MTNQIKWSKGFQLTKDPNADGNWQLTNGSKVLFYDKPSEILGRIINSDLIEASELREALRAMKDSKHKKAFFGAFGGFLCTNE